MIKSPMNNNTRDLKTHQIGFLGAGKMAQALAKGILSSDKLLVSVVSGIDLDVLKKDISSDVPVIRMMPNTPCLVQEGAATFCCDIHVTQEHKDIFNQLMKPNFPVLEEIPEKLIDASVGVSGSSPAYLYIIAEALADGGVKMGLPRDVSNRLAYQTIKGSGEMLLRTGEHPGILKDNVCSPSGNTIHAVHVLEQGNIRSTIMSAVEAAASRWKKNL